MGAAEPPGTQQAAPVPLPSTAAPAADAHLRRLACIPVQGMRMWVTPARCESCLGEAVTQRH